MANNSLISPRRALGVLIPLFLVSALLACALISVANDTYAFVKPDRAATLSISSPVSARELCRTLRQNGVIENDAVFYLYIKSKGKSDDVSLLLGEWTLNSNMSYREILLEIF